jgi:hypothetical protein
MREHIKNFLNEEQDPKAIEKISAKLDTLLMKNEEVGYIAVQKKPAITVFPDSLVVTNKRIILCKPKNLGLSMEFVDYDWDDITGTFVKENILGSEFSFSTKSELTISIDYIPKNQARKLYTYAKEQLDILKNGISPAAAEIVEDPKESVFEEMETEEVTHFAEIMPVPPVYTEAVAENAGSTGDKTWSELSQDELFEKLQNYKKLLDNGLILQGEYDTFKKEILSHM